MKKRILIALILMVPCSALLILNCSAGGGSSSGTQTVVSPPQTGCIGEGGAPTTTPAGTAALTWDAVDASILGGYRVYYGTVPGIYLQQRGEGLNAGNATSLTVAGLNKGVRYYFAVTSYDTTGWETTYSNEVCKVIS
jgi:hypothetical protein